MDKAFLAEIKAAALASGEWYESESEGMWIFPDGTGIASTSWANIHGTLAVSVGLAESGEIRDYDGAIHTLLSFGLVRRRGSYTYQTFDTSGFGIIEKYALKAGDNRFTVDVVARNESFYRLDYEAAGFSVSKAMQEERRAGAVDRYSQDERLSFI